MTEVAGPEPIALDQPCLFDTGVWTWVRDRRFPKLAEWFNDLAAGGLVLVSDLVALELTRLAPNLDRASALADTLARFETIPVPPIASAEARDLQLAMAGAGDHRRVPPIDLLHAATAISAGVPLVHYDKDYERIAKVSGLGQRWFVPPGSLAD